MDQKSTANGTDKRNWRERLGIGTTKEMPKLSEDFKPVVPKAPVAGARPAVKPAPMAPRAIVKPAAPPLPPEKLADKLKAQRDASEKMAEQRLQVARQRAEITPPAPPAAPVVHAANKVVNGNGLANASGPTAVKPVGAKPKFTFAEEAMEAAPPPPVPVKPPIAPTIAPAPKPPQVLVPPVMTPPRQPLGAERPVMPPRPPMQQVQPPIAPPAYQPPAYQPQAYQPQYQSGYAPQPPMPGYRPMDPAQRYTPPLPPQMQPQAPMTPPVVPQNRGFAPQPQRTGFSPQPRLQMPPAGYPQADGGYAPDPRLQAPVRPGPSLSSGGEADVFEDARPSQRRASANDYTQAYNMEQGFEEEAPRGRGLGLLIAVLVLAGLIAGGLIYFYLNNIKSQTAGGTTGETPVVVAPETPAKTPPEAPVDVTPTSTDRSLVAGTPTKKQIYDRIVGDKEVLGGDVLQTEEQPIAPADVAPPVDAAPLTPPEDTPKPAVTDGEENPLPLPPPPGDGGNDQQGALPDAGKQDSAAIIPAASESEAADSSSDQTKLTLDSDVTKNDSAATGSEALVESNDSPAAAPVPGEETPAVAAVEEEAIVEPEPKPAKRQLVVEKPKVKKPLVKSEKSLGDKPVVLVAPVKKPKVVAAEEDVASTTPLASPEPGATDSLYDGAGVVDPNAGDKPAAPVPVKKKKTLADLFTGEADAPDAPVAPLAEEVDIAPVEPAKKKLAALDVPAAETPAAGNGGFVVQLASFSSKGEATQAFAQLKSKHQALAPLSGIVNETTVGGSKRFNLMAGTLASRAQASALCTKLLSAGERDCQVRSR